VALDRDKWHDFELRIGGSFHVQIGLVASPLLIESRKHLLHLPG
jgi:hypothetical protein